MDLFLVADWSIFGGTFFKKLKRFFLESVSRGIMAYSFFIYAYDLDDADCIVRKMDTIEIGERGSVEFVQVTGAVKVIFHYKTRTGQGETMVNGLNDERYGRSTMRIHLEDRDGTLHWHRTPTYKKTRKN